MTDQRIATVFGGTGFLGHAVVQFLAERGYQIRVPTRDLTKADDLLLMGKVGQIVPFAASVKSDMAVADSLRDSSLVINLIGELVEHEKNGFQATHVETAARVARIAKSEGVARFIHISALGADMKSLSRYARTKAIGEEAVRAFFPDATLFRPTIMFGPRDKFFNKFAVMARYLPFVPLFGGGLTRFQPIYVGDVAKAILAALDRPETCGNLYLLGGPKVYSFKELMSLLVKTMGIQRCFISVPWWLASWKARFFELFPNPILTREQVDLLKIDHTLRLQHGGRAPDVAALGINLTPLEEILPTYIPSVSS